MPEATGHKIPVTILTGFLGSGKTTLLNRVLTEQHGQRIAVIENEFGEIGVDQNLVINAEEEIFEMSNGCICCTVRGDLIRVLGNLMKRRDKFDRVLVETTGLADPGPVAQTFFMDEEIQSDFKLDGIITLVDAKHVALHLDESKEAKEQVAFADVLVLNKTDLVDAASVDALERRVRGMNSMAKVLRAEMAAVPMQQVLDVGGFDLSRALEHKPTFLEPEYPFEWAGVYALASNLVLELASGPDPTMSIVVAPISDQFAVGKLAEDVFRRFADAPCLLPPGGAIALENTHYKLDLARKGGKNFTIALPKPGRYALFTQHLPEEFELRVRRPDGTDAQPINQKRFAPAHEHDVTVTSVGIQLPGSVSEAKLNKWLSALLRDKGADIFRMKGILNVAGEDRRFVFQGVHMLFDGRPDRPWGTDRRVNQLVFIGRNLDRQGLEKGFGACLS